MNRAAFAVLAFCAAAAAPPAGEAGRAYLTHGSPLDREVRVEDGKWRAGDQRFDADEILFVRFSDAPPPARMAAGVFLRGGVLLAGNLESLIGETAVFLPAWSAAPLKLKRADLAAAFFPLPAEEEENFPAVSRYASLFAALHEPAAGTPAAEHPRGSFLPGKRNGVLYRNLDRAAGKLARLGAEKAFIEQENGELLTPDRGLIRAVEFETAELKDEPREQEFVVRLRGGEVLRGRILGLDERKLIIQTAFAGRLEIARETLAAAFPAGEKRGAVRWLSRLTPALNVQTPFFEARFPMRLDLSCEGRLLILGGLVCDRGLGVHAKSELRYALDGKPGKRMRALVGVDDETRGRGAAVARVLLDGREAWNSGLLRGGGPPIALELELGKAKALTLLVDYGPEDDDSGDHVDWGWAAIVQP